MPTTIGRREYYCPAVTNQTSLKHVFHLLRNGIQQMTLFAFLVLFSISLNAQVTNPRTLPNEWPNYGIGDPYIMKFLGKFYLYCSTRDTYRGVKVWSSWDLANWTYEGDCGLGSNATSTGAYAPEVIYWNGKFYMYTSPAGNGHYIFSADSPVGPFTVVTGNWGQSIDGSVFIDDNNNMYFSRAGNGQIITHAMNGPLYVNPAGNNSGASLSGWTEGSTIFKRNGLYYMTYTGNHVFSPGYRVNYSISGAPLTGYQPKPPAPLLLKTHGPFAGLGHSSSFIGPDLDTWYITYHNRIPQIPGNPGPRRQLNIDPMGFNGDKLVVFGPVNWTQPAPSLPTFYDRFDRTTIGPNWVNVNGGNWGIYGAHLMWQNNSSAATWFRQVTATATAAEYTAEFNMKEMSRGSNAARMGAVFSYADENTFGSALLSSYDNTLYTSIRVSGTVVASQAISMPAGWDYQKWHVIRVEKQGTTFRIYFDGMLKSTLTASGIGAGKIGVTTFQDHADFGYTAFTNHVWQSAVWDFHKPVPGTIEAVHFNSGGQNVGNFDNTPTNTGGQYRAGSADISVCPGCGFRINSNTGGEWYKYNVNVRVAGNYNVGLRYTSANASQVRFRLNGVDVSGVVNLPATGGYSNWITHIIENINLPSAGNQVLTVETVSGDFDFYYMEWAEASTNTPAGFEDFSETSYDMGFWYFLTGPWVQPGSSGRASMGSPGFGKIMMGDDRWTDYSVEADLSIPSAGGNAGLLFRAKNASYAVDPPGGNPDAAGTDYVQGYYAGVETGGVVLGKQNYNWTGMAFHNRSLAAGTVHKLRAVIKGINIKVYLDNMTTPVIDVNDNDCWLHGTAGIRVHNGVGTTFDNFRITEDPGTMAAHATQSLSDFSIAPNPVDDKVTVTYVPNKSEKLTIRMYDLQGRVVRNVFEGQGTEGSVNRFVVDRKGLVAGTYFVRVITPGDNRQLALIYK
jgi:xylan 1,4-beta-xylosidase